MVNAFTNFAVVLLRQLARLGVGCILFATYASADIISNTFSEDGYFDPSVSCGIVWSGGGAAEAFAVRFTPTDDYNLSSVTVALSNTAGNANNLNISIVADANNSPTGSTLDTLAIDPNIPLNGNPQPYTFSSSLQPMLLSGANYWLVLQPSTLNVVNQNNDSEYIWYLNILGASGALDYRLYDFSGNTWLNWQGYNNATLPAFRIDGLVAVPEPSTIALSAVGIAALFFFRRRAK